MSHRRIQFSVALVASALLLTAGTCGDDPVNTEPKPAAKLGVATAPSSSTVSGTVFAVQPAIQVQNVDGGSVASAGVVVTAAITAGGGTLGGTTTATTDATGKATFTNLFITGTAGDRTITYSAPSLTSATSTVTITASTATNIAFCGGQAPVWFAYQNGTSGGWTKLTAKADGSFDVPLSGTVGGIAFVTTGTNGGSSSGYNTSVVYATKTELASIGCALGDPAAGTKTINGTVANVSVSQFSDIAFADQAAFVTGSSPNYQLTNVSDGAHDLVAGRAPSASSSYLPDKYIVRRALNPASGSSFAVLDFNATEAQAGVSAAFTLNNVGTEDWQIGGELVTANLTRGLLSYVSGTGGTNAVSTYQALAASQRLTTDNLELFAVAQAATGTSERGYQVQNVATVGARTATLGPALNTPTVSSVATSPSVRMRTQLTSQTQYAGAIETYYDQGSPATRSAFVFVSSGYLGATPTTWDVTMPDLSAASYLATYGLQSGTPVDWRIQAESGIPVGTGEIATLYAMRESSTGVTVRKGLMRGLAAQRTVWK